MIRRSTWMIAVAGLALSVPCVAQQEGGYWRAASSTAHGITGDIAISDERVTINFTGFLIARVRALTPQEIAAAFDAGQNAPGGGSLYGLDIPGTKKFMHKNTLCGGEDAVWMATYVNGKQLQVAFFSGSQPPPLTVDGLANSTSLCGTFGYAR